MSGFNFDYWKAQINKQLDELDQRLLSNEYVKTLNEKTQVRPSYLALSVGSLLVLFLVWGAGAQFVTNLVGFAYPLYESFRSLQSGGSSGSQQQQQHWLTYWIVFALFALIESLTDFFLYWIPLYHLVKVCFLLWCFWPTTRGAEVIYLRVVEPMLVRYEGKIESAGRESRRAASRIINEVGSDIQQAAAEGERGSVTGTVEGEK